MRDLCKIIFSMFFITFILCTVGHSPSYAAVPRLINYQARLADKAGAPLEGSYSLTFKIYDAETAGNLLWEEAHQGVVIQKGIFSVLLGSVTNLNLSFDKSYFLEIKVGTEVMSPRQRIASSAYAIRSEIADIASMAEQANNAISTNNADTVDNLHASTTPQPNKLVALDSSAKIPNSILPIGTMQKITTVTCTSLSTVISSSLDGNSDDLYFISWYGTAVINGYPTYFGIALNNDTNSDNYRGYVKGGGGGYSGDEKGISGYGMLYLGDVPNLERGGCIYHLDGSAVIHANSGYRRSSAGFHTHSGGTSEFANWGQFFIGGVWKNATDNITRMDFVIVESSSHPPTSINIIVTLYKITM